MNPIKLVRPNEVPLLEAAGYRNAGPSSKFPNFVVMHLPGCDPAPAGADEEMEHIANAVACLGGDA